MFADIPHTTAGIGSPWAAPWRGEVLFLQATDDHEITPCAEKHLFITFNYLISWEYLSLSPCQNPNATALTPLSSTPPT
jgi:hypothetical protein